MTGAAWRTDRELRPEIGMAVVHARDEREEFEPVCVPCVGGHHARQDLRQHRRPVVIEQIAVRKPVFDDVPEAQERQDAVAGVRRAQALVGGLAVEDGVAHVRRVSHVAVRRSGEAIHVNGLQAASRPASVSR